MTCKSANNSMNEFKRDSDGENLLHWYNLNFEATIRVNSVVLQ